MAKKNKIDMPMSTAGITRYFDDYKTSITFQPTQVLFMVGAIVAIIILLHIYGSSFFGVT